MIAKGTAHNNGAKLAQYMTTGKDGERAELWQLRGIEATNIKDGFRDVQIMADGTRCQQPFFHVQVRNPGGEKLTRQQWEITANRIERMLGLTGQPRAIAFHTNDKTGHEHMHVAWSRIDQNTLTAKQLPFFKDRLKKISRELELHFGLTIVASKREGPIKYAPTRAEEEQARRTGFDIHEVRNTIRECWDHSDCGRSFEAALADKDLTLAQGDRRGFVVIDYRGGLHVLSKRILDMTAAKIRDRLSDLDVNQLPGVEQARDFIRDASRDRQQEKPAPSWDRDRNDNAWNDAVAKAAIEKAKIDRRFVEPKPDKSVPSWDRDRDDNAWHDAVAKAAIEKEKIERQFIDPDRKKAERAGSREEKKWPAMAPQPERKFWTDFEKAGKQAERDTRTENLKGVEARIWKVWRQSHTSKALDADLIWPNPRQGYRIDAKAFAAALDEKGIAFAVVTKQEAERSHREAEFAKAVGNYAPSFKEAEIVAVTRPGLSTGATAK